MQGTIDSPETAVAVRYSGGLDQAGLPGPEAWDTARQVFFASDWKGQNVDPNRQTTVAVLWSPEELFLRFRCHYRTLTVFKQSDPGGRRDHLWDRDVAEIFLQPPGREARNYWEFEIAPNGMWIDLEISAGAKRDPQSGMRSRVFVDQNTQIWVAELAIPMRVLDPQFDPSQAWRVNFFRVEGAAEPRFYSAWQGTHTPQPNFHVPEAFGELRFQTK